VIVIIEFEIYRAMRITLIIHALAPGGAERVMARMANYWAGKGREVTLITFRAKDTDFYEISPNVNRVALDIIHVSRFGLVALWTKLLSAKKLRRAIIESNPDVVISFIDITNIYTLVATRGLSVKVFISERTDISQYSIGKIESWLRCLTYTWASAVVVQTEGVAQWMRLHLKCKRVAVIPNPIVMDKVNYDKLTLKDVIDNYKAQGTIVAMGRMCRQKGFDLLIEAFAIATVSYPEWILVIFGEGEERCNLFSLSKELGISNRVFMPGVVKEPIPLLQQADIFVMSSRLEGFPNALLEAMACGLPVISFDCPSGPNEIIRDGIDGLLVPPEDVDAMANAMKRLIEDEKERKRLGERAREVNDRFGIEKIMKQWEELLQ